MTVDMRGLAAGSADRRTYQVITGRTSGLQHIVDAADHAQYEHECQQESSDAKTIRMGTPQLLPCAHDRNRMPRGARSGDKLGRHGELRRIFAQAEAQPVVCTTVARIRWPRKARAPALQRRTRSTVATRSVVEFESCVARADFRNRARNLAANTLHFLTPPARSAWQKHNSARQKL